MSKEVQAYARALIYVADTIDIIFTKFAWTNQNSNLFTLFLKSSRDFNSFNLSGISFQILVPKYLRGSNRWHTVLMSGI